MIERGIDRLVEQAIEQGVLPRDRQVIARYGLISGSHTIIGLLGALIVGVFLGLWQSVLLAALVGATFRFFAGGAHFQNPSVCFIYTVISLNGIAVVGNLLTTWFYSLPNGMHCIMGVGLGVVMVTLGLEIVERYVPVDNPNRPITNAKEIARLKLLSFATVLFVTGLYLLLRTLYAPTRLSAVIAMAYFLQLFSLTPWCANLFCTVEKLIGRLDT